LFRIDIFHFQHPEDPFLGEYYRPLQSVSHAIDYFFWKLNPVGYRLGNILIHSINSFLLYLLVRLLFKNKILGILSAILFCIHPIEVSDIAFISVRAVPLEMLFMLFSIITLMHYFLYQKNMNYLLSLSSFVLAFLSREDALLLPLFIILSAITLGINKRRIFFNLLPFIFIAIAYLIWRSHFIPCGKLHLQDLISLKSLKGFFYYLGEYFCQLILPVGSQRLIFGESMIFRFILFLLSFVIIGFLLIKAIIFKDKEVIFGAGFYFIGLLPVINLVTTIPLFGPLLSEHYVYIASAGFFVLVAYLIIKLYSRFKKIAIICFILMTAVYSSLTVIDNMNYKDDITFYNHILRLDPKNTFLRVNLGTAYFKKKMYDKAIGQARVALAAEPSAWDAYLLLGNVFKGQGKIDKAMDSYKTAAILYPRSSEAFNNIALIYQEQGKDKEAYENFKKALQMDPESLLVLKNLSAFLIKGKSYREAMALCEKTLQLNPDDIDARIKKGVIFAESGYFNEAEAAFKEALRLDPLSVDALKNLGALYGNTGNFGEAILFWKKALAINPSLEEAKQNIKEAERLKKSLDK
jgi:tetratricopeptide (TPR) repeat protein